MSHSLASRLIALSCLLLLITASENGQALDVDAFPESRVPSFRNEVMAVLSKAGCNMGTCHGNANGKGGFKLSLRGQSPSQDLDTLTRHAGARRINSLQPDSSVLLQKPAMIVPHEGSRRFGTSSDEYRILHDWIAAGSPNDVGDGPTLVKLNAEPKHATLYAPDTAAQIRVTAEFSDGRIRDVTSLAVFDSSATFVSVSESGIATTERAGLTTVTVRYLEQQVPVRLEFVPERPGFVRSAPKPSSFVDELVFQQLERLKINPSPVCDDTAFLRRAFLDLTGLLPSSEKARQFTTSKNVDKRARLIDELLDSSEFLDMQALRWADLLRVEEKTLDTKGVEVFHGWIRESFQKRKPLNVMAGELLASRGSTYKVPPTNFYRALRVPESRAEASAQVFLGIRLQCAKCHNHPFDRWTQEDYYGWTNFFARVDYKIVENKRRDKNDKHEFNGEQIVLIQDKGEVKNPATGESAGLRFLGESSDLDVDAGSGEVKLDRLQRLANWISSADNGRFAATQANRIWYQIMGQSIVDPVDDFRSTNPPVNPELLEALQREFVDHDFSSRHLMRVIMNSKVYQLSSAENETNSGDEVLFSRSVPRRLTAEQMVDAIGQVLDVPIRFGGQRSGIKAVQIAGVRNGGNRYAPPEIGDRFLALFGKPSRLLTCDCERTNDTTLAQTFEMVSGELVDELLRSSEGRIAREVEQGGDAGDLIAELYWSALSRGPTALELSASMVHVERSGNRQRAFEDVAWALLNSNEFIFRR